MSQTVNGFPVPQGFTAAGVKAGIKKSGKEDIALIVSDVPAATAAMFTTNAMAAAPVILSRQAAAGGFAKAVVINSGCANACTGEQGLADAGAMAALTAELLGVAANEVLVASTGIIGVNLPMDKVSGGIKRAAAALSPAGFDAAVRAIMTTDTFAKISGCEITLGGAPVRLYGLAKGAGMISPNMATTLAVVATDAAIAPGVLRQALWEAVKYSFNMITVDGDNSTNDMVAVMANGLAANPAIDSTAAAGYAEFAAALRTVLTDLAKLVVRDGEGATKFLEITVTGADNFVDAKTAAMAVAKSPLVKTAFFGQDPNWGRILCAAGYSGAQVDPGKITLDIGGIRVVSAGTDACEDGQKLQEVMAARDIKVAIDLGCGAAAATVWTCDFSYEYVKINGDYST